MTINKNKLNLYALTLNFCKNKNFFQDFDLSVSLFSFFFFNNGIDEQLGGRLVTTLVFLTSGVASNSSSLTF